ncbi:uncharacterized protein LOC121853436 isoform X1 [Homarus americanus]|uniref:uncharacterized protein LOC121853436 isoform X1 n=1 Tax=Homarus americanus TaxID=6706 RepID=UPI001C4841EF|nr:uncharacterized protein LOC121853436 isoform X1 [Homarus americanus]
MTVGKMSERRVFESLCLEPCKRGFSYDSALLVDVDRASDFDEAVIRLTTKCNSIITQLRTLGNHVAEFSVTTTKVSCLEAKSPTSNSIKTKTCGDTFGYPITHVFNTPDTRNLRVMEEQWCGLKQKNYSGMVAVARLSRSSIPRNGSGGKYSVRILTEALLSHIQAYFMFQSYNPDFQRWTISGTGNKNESPEDEYLIYLVYRIQHVDAVNIHKKVKRQSEMEKLEKNWQLKACTTKRRRRHTSGESSISNSSSASSNPSGGATYLSPPVTRSGRHALDIAATGNTPHRRYPTERLPSQGCTEKNDFVLDWTNWSTPRALKSPSLQSADDNRFFQKTPMSLRNRKEVFKKNTRLNKIKPVIQKPQRRLSQRRLSLK